MLIVILETLEEEYLLSAPVKTGSRNQQRTTNVPTWIIVGIRWPRLTDASVLVELIVGIHDVIAGVQVSSAVELAATALGVGVYHDGTLGVFGSEIRGQDFHFRDHLRVRVHGSRCAKSARIK